MKPLRLTTHALEQARERGASPREIETAVREGDREPAMRGRLLCRFNFPFGSYWSGSYYAIKQVASVIKEEAEEIVVITVYTFSF